jgi:hypothetical protein
MSPEEPDSFTDILELAMEVPHKGDKRACTAVRSDDRCPVRTTERVLCVIAYRPSEISTVEIKKVWIRGSGTQKNLLDDLQEVTYLLL